MCWTCESLAWVSRLLHWQTPCFLPEPPRLVLSSRSLLAGTSGLANVSVVVLLSTTGAMLPSTLGRPDLRQISKLNCCIEATAAGHIKWDVHTHGTSGGVQELGCTCTCRAAILWHKQAATCPCKSAAASDMCMTHPLVGPRGKIILQPPARKSLVSLSTH
jgi:hypothetical protein